MMKCLHRYSSGIHYCHRLSVSALMDRCWLSTCAIRLGLCSIHALDDLKHILIGYVGTLLITSLWNPSTTYRSNSVIGITGKESDPCCSDSPLMTDHRIKDYYNHLIKSATTPSGVMVTTDDNTIVYYPGRRDFIFLNSEWSCACVKYIFAVTHGIVTIANKSGGWYCLRIPSIPESS